MRALRGTTAGGPHPAQPRHPGLVGLLPACGVGAGVQRADHHVWTLTYKWAKFSHPHKGKRWITGRYFGAFNRPGGRWCSATAESGAYLLKFAWMKITRHTLVKGMGVPGRPGPGRLLGGPRRRGNPPLRRAELRLLKAQQARCAVCGGLLIHADQGRSTPTRGTVDHRCAQGGPPPGDHHRPGTRDNRTSAPPSVSSTPLPAPAARRADGGPALLQS